MAEWLPGEGSGTSPCPPPVSVPGRLGALSERRSPGHLFRPAPGIVSGKIYRVPLASLVVPAGTAGRPAGRGHTAIPLSVFRSVIVPA